MLRAISLSHQTATLEVRQALQFSKEEAADFMTLLKGSGMVEGVMVIATCNRTEVYFEAATTTVAEVQQALLQFKDLQSHAAYQHIFTHYNYSESTLHYLLEVGLGLRSQVIGDRQIIGQFKESYQQTSSLKLGSPLLHKALQTLFRAHKRVHNETGFRSGASSVGYAALERIADFIPRKEFGTKSLLLIGAGQMGADVAKYAASFGFREISITNRTTAKAAELAANMHLHYLPYNELLPALPAYDIVIACVSGGEQLSAGQFGQSTRKRVVLDLSVPQQISPEVGRLEHTTLVNIDQITSHTQAVKAARLESVAAVEAIIEEETILFAEWLQELPVASTINDLKSFFASVLESELGKLNDHLPQGYTQVVAKAALDRLIRRPAGALRAADDASRQQLLDSLNTLFKTV